MLVDYVICHVWLLMFSKLTFKFVDPIKVSGWISRNCWSTLIWIFLYCRFKTVFVEQSLALPGSAKFSGGQNLLITVGGFFSEREYSEADWLVPVIITTSL